MDRCRRTLETHLWAQQALDVDGLDETQKQTQRREPSPGDGHGSLRLVEPASANPLPVGSGLDPHTNGGQQ